MFGRGISGIANKYPALEPPPCRSLIPIVLVKDDRTIIKINK